MTAMTTILVEICLDSIESAVAAAEGGAHRVELCDNLPEGGTTPSRGMIAVARDAIEIGLHVLVRPRGGDFCYSEREVEVMRKDVETIGELGAEGVVLGALLADGSVDCRLTRDLVERARPMSVTFHRAFDRSRNATEALEQLLELGVDRVLTSGQAPSALEGLERLTELVDVAGERLTILVGGGVSARTARAIVDGSGAREIHAGSSVTETITSRMLHQNPDVALGRLSGESEYARQQVSAARVRKLVESVNEPG